MGASKACARWRSAGRVFGEPAIVDAGEIGAKRFAVDVPGRQALGRPRVVPVEEEPVGPLKTLDDSERAVEPAVAFLRRDQLHAFGRHQAPDKAGDVGRRGMHRGSPIALAVAPDQVGG
jgi:hypothetical protein